MTNITARRVRALALGLLLCLTFGFILFGGTPASATANPKFSGETNVSKSAQLSLQPVMHTTPDGKMHMVWIEMTVPGLPWEIRYSNSSDGGKTWSKADKLSVNSSNLSSTMMDVGMAVDSRNQVHVVWSERDRTRNLHINYRRRDAAGNWTDRVGLANQINGGGDTYSGTPNIDIAINPAAPDVIHVVWKGTDGSNRYAKWAIYYANSTDGGQTWGGYMPVSTVASGFRFYNFADQANIMAEANGDLHVMWRGATSGISARHRINGVWGKIERVDSYGWWPTMALNPKGGIYAAYQGKSPSGGTARAIRFVKWTPTSGGNGTWTKPNVLTDPSGNYLSHPSLTIDGDGRIFLAYDRSDGDFGIAYRTSTDGKRFSAAQSVTKTRAQFPRINFHNGMYTLVYTARIGTQDYTGHPNYDIVFRKAAG